MTDRIVVVLGSKQKDILRYAIFTSTHENLVSSENIKYLNEKLQEATVVNGHLHRALILADFEADLVAADDGHLPGILIHHLSTCKISPDALTIEAL